jgi:hypothetical protein
MRVDARITIKFDPLPDRKRVKELQYHLMHRFEREIFWTWDTDYTSKEKKKFMIDFVRPVEDGQYYFDSDQDMTGYWELRLWPRYYGEGYERGPGLQFAGILFYLASQPDIKEVWYGGDSSGTRGELYDKDKAVELMAYYCEHGRLPYQRVFDRDNKRQPDCPYCEVPMMQNGFGGRYAAFYCAGCGSEIKLRDEAFDKWQAGEPYEPTKARNAALGEPELEIF